MHTDLLETILVVSNVFNGDRREKTILFINEELAVKKAERISGLIALSSNSLILSSGPVM